MIRLTALIEIEGQATRALTCESSAPSIIIGRDPGVDFRIPLTTVSRRHARISEVDGRYVVEDLGSTHGTVLGGRRLGQGEKKVLRDGDILELTRARITARIESDAARIDPGEGTRAVAARAVQGILGSLGEPRGAGPHLRVLSGPGEGAELPLAGSQTEWILGRSRDCDLVLDDPNVSRRHAAVRRERNGYAVADLGSRNGVLVGDRRIDEPRTLRDSDEIAIGPVKLVYVDPDRELLEGLDDLPGMATPTAGEPARTADPGAVAAGPGAPPASAMAGEPDLEAIDPELLEPVSGKLPVEWIVIGVGAVLMAAVVAAVVVLLV